MKLIGEVIKAVTTGDTLTIEVQAKPPRSAFWRRLAVTSIDMPHTEYSRRAFYIGRKVRIDVQAA